MSKKDQIRIGAEVGPNTRLVERRRNGRISVGTLTPMKDGQSLLTGAEIVKVSLDEDDEWHDVETIYAPEPALSGPPQVATPAEREGWNRVFGKQKVGIA